MVEYRLARVQQQSLGMLFWDVCVQPYFRTASAQILLSLFLLASCEPTFVPCMEKKAKKEKTKRERERLPWSACTLLGYLLLFVEPHKNAPRNVKRGLWKKKKEIKHERHPDYRLNCTDDNVCKFIERQVLCKCQMFCVCCEWIWAVKEKDWNVLKLCKPDGSKRSQGQHFSVCLFYLLPNL